DSLRVKLEGADDLARTLAAALDIAWRKDIAAHAVDRRTRSGEFVDAMTELEGDEPLLLAIAHARNERREHARPGSPGKMKTRHRIAVTCCATAATLRPADHRKKPQAALAQPRPFLAGGESDISLCPAARPMIFFAIEGGGAHPILQRERVRVADAHAA